MTNHLARRCTRSMIYGQNEIHSPLAVVRPNVCESINQLIAVFSNRFLLWAHSSPSAEIPYLQIILFSLLPNRSLTAILIANIAICVHKFLPSFHWLVCVCACVLLREPLLCVNLLRFWSDSFFCLAISFDLFVTGIKHTHILPCVVEYNYFCFYFSIQFNCLILPYFVDFQSFILWRYAAIVREFRFNRIEILIALHISILARQIVRYVNGQCLTLTHSSTTCQIY